ncbi:MAG: hypothetical protein R3E31_09475 [Chloroflexota bacterium]
MRDAPADAEMVSHQLLMRANYVRPIGAGIYTFMPLGYRVIRKIWDIMAEEMDAINGQEMWMPNLHPAALGQATGRWDTVDVLMKAQAAGIGNMRCRQRMKKRQDPRLREIESYRDLPRVVYHISKKFRDELRAWRLAALARIYHEGCLHTRHKCRGVGCLLSVHVAGVSQHFCALWRAGAGH